MTQDGQGQIVTGASACVGPIFYRLLALKEFDLVFHREDLTPEFESADFR